MFRPSARLKGMGIGGLFLAGFGGLWMLAALNSLSWVWLVACDVVPASLLALRSISLIVTSRELAAAEPPPSTEEAAAARRLGRRFGWVVMIEFGAIAIAANLLAQFGRADWILAAIGFIVGAHFIPMARVYKFRLYYWTGGIEMALCGAIALLMRQRLPLADPLFGLVMALTLWATVVLLLAQGAHLAARVKAAAPSASP
ncbi:MAG: DUF7010 family protein [Terriglobales bacterium]